MGDVLIEAMTRAVGKDWTADMQKAWSELWNKSCDMLMQIIGLYLYACVRACVRVRVSRRESDRHKWVEGSDKFCFCVCVCLNAGLCAPASVHVRTCSCLCACACLCALMCTCLCVCMRF